MSAVRPTKAQKAYSAACDACGQWARSTPAESLLQADRERVAKSYGIQPAHAASIIANACRERKL